MQVVSDKVVFVKPVISAEDRVSINPKTDANSKVMCAVLCFSSGVTLCSSSRSFSYLHFPSLVRHSHGCFSHLSRPASSQIDNDMRVVERKDHIVWPWAALAVLLVAVAAGAGLPLMSSWQDQVAVVCVIG